MGLLCTAGLLQAAMLPLLRAATGAYHEGLHGHPLLAPLQDDAISLDDYRWCIRAFHLAYSIAGDAVSYKPLPGFDVPALGWLEADIRTHGIAPVHVPATEYPMVDSYSRYMGLAYVKQGSTLGGRGISKHLTRTLGLKDGVTNHFFAGFGDETGGRWKEFAARLDDDRLDEDAVVDQAIRTFALITEACDLVLDKKTAAE